MPGAKQHTGKLIERPLGRSIVLTSVQCCTTDYGQCKVNGVTGACILGQACHGQGGIMTPGKCPGAPLGITVSLIARMPWEKLMAYSVVPAGPDHDRDSPQSLCPARRLPRSGLASLTAEPAFMYPPSVQQILLVL